MSFTLTETGLELYNQLKALRADIAKEEVIPVYYVFSNTALMDMVVKQPIDEATFLTCEKVGQKGYDRYGERFIYLIRQFTLTHKGPYYKGAPDYSKSYHSFLTEEGRRLLEQLKISRLSIAAVHDVEPTIMVNDQTLISFVVLLPYSREEMVRIYGVTKDYRDLYMDTFIKIIYNFTHGFKKRLYHLDMPRPRFTLTKEEASHFRYQEKMTATNIAKELNRIASSEITCSATDITKLVKKYDYYKNGFDNTVIISDVGKAFGLLKESRLTKNNEHYEMVLYSMEAQNKIVQWFIDQ